MDKHREVAIKILNEFEEIFDELGITIPDQMREEDEGEARLYGLNYYHMEDAIYSILKESFPPVSPVTFKETES